jgi:hypothetical protein
MDIKKILKWTIFAYMITTISAGPLEVGRKNFMGDILQIQELILGGKSFENFKTDRKTVEKPKRVLATIWNYFYPEPVKQNYDHLLLKIEDFGLLFNIFFQNKEMTVRFVSFQDFLKEEVSREMKNSGPTSDCLNFVRKTILDSIIANNSNEELFLSLPYRIPINETALKIQNGKACEKINTFLYEIRLEKMIKKYFYEILKIDNKLIEFSKYSDENESSGERIFLKVEGNILRENFDYYLITDSFEKNLTTYKSEILLNSTITKTSERSTETNGDRSVLTKAHEKDSGKNKNFPASLKTNIEDSIQLLYKANKINELGFTNCAIRPETIIMNNGHRSIFYISDFEHSTDKDTCPTDKLTKFSAPELFKREFNSMFNNLNDFMILKVNLVDSFAAAFVISYLILPDTKFEQIANDYFDYMKTPKYHSPQKQSALLISKIEDELNLALNHEGLNYEDSKARIMFCKVIARMLDIDPSKRMSLPVALFLLYQIYDLSAREGNRYETLLEDILNDERLKTRLGINVKLEEIPFYRRAERKEYWKNESAEYKKTIEKVEVFLGFRSNTPDGSKTQIRV